MLLDKALHESWMINNRSRMLLQPTQHVTRSLNPWRIDESVQHAAIASHRKATAVRRCPRVWRNLDAVVLRQRSNDAAFALVRMPDNDKHGCTHRASPPGYGCATSDGNDCTRSQGSPTVASLRCQIAHCC